MLKISFEFWNCEISIVRHLEVLLLVFETQKLQLNQSKGFEINRHCSDTKSEKVLNEKLFLQTFFGSHQTQS